jgi:DNA invertase Pin-like site-specific DNA recombinase
MFQMLGVFGEFERGIIKERINAGLARARSNGTKLGRKRVKPSVEERIHKLRKGILKIGREVSAGGRDFRLARACIRGCSLTQGPAGDQVKA